jgi:acyl phosphate:glycerol-3-phosphate acyltransferase
MWQTYLTVATVAYLLGSIPFGYILVKLFLKQDIRQTGSGNIGATNVARSGKKGLAIATLFLDALKGFLAVVFASALPIDALFRRIDALSQPNYAASAGWEPNSTQLAVAAICAILGHCFPIWLKFRGGKGVATAVGAFAGVSGLAVTVCLIVFAILFALTRVVSLSSIIGAAAFPFALFFSSGDSHPVFFLIAAGSSTIIILKHHANIRRLLNGTEPRFTTKKAVPDPIQVEKNA